MSQFDSLGETTFSINDPTIEKAPPFKYTRSIAYNGSYWLAAGTIVIRSVGIKTFSDVRQYELDADYYTGQINQNVLDGDITDARRSELNIIYQTEKNKNL
jgi:hypothetical protein